MAASDARDGAARGGQSGTEEDVVSSVSIATAIFAEGEKLAAAGDHDQALVCFDRVVEQFGASDDPGVREVVAEALAGQVDVLGDLQRFADADRAIEELLVR